MTRPGCGKKTKSGRHRKHTPITSKSQQGAMGAAYAAKTGKMSKSELHGPAKKMAKSMIKKELRSHLKESGGKKLPKKSRKRKSSRRKKRNNRPHHRSR